jgi:hypothetical protein
MAAAALLVVSVALMVVLFVYLTAPKDAIRKDFTEAPLNVQTNVFAVQKSTVTVGITVPSECAEPGPCHIGLSFRPVMGNPFLSLRVGSDLRPIATRQLVQMKTYATTLMQEDDIFLGRCNTATILNNACYVYADLMDTHTAISVNVLANATVYASA